MITSIHDLMVKHGAIRPKYAGVLLTEWCRIYTNTRVRNMVS